jgi:hypothetical protein
MGILQGLRKLHESLETHPPDKKEAEQLLESLRWHADMLVTNDFDERVWLKPLIVDGKRIGITDCCFEDNPCDHHKRLAATGKAA